DPYDDEHFNYPPSTVPAFALLALVPFPALVVLATVLNAVGYLALVFLARRALQAQGDPTAGRLSPAAPAVCAATVALSFASRYGLILGQLPALVTVALLAALTAQGRGRPVQAGAWLVVAHLKIATMLPFLLLFLR